MFSKIYLDTAPLIYFLENHPRYALKVQDILQGNSSDGCKFATSVITNVEYLPKPMRENKQDLVFAYNALKSILNMEVISVIEDISMEAARNALAMGLSQAQVSQITGLSVEDIARL